VLEDLGYDPSMARWAAAADASLARVVRVDRGLVSVLGADGPQRAGIGGGLLGSMARDRWSGPVVGDWCVLRDWPDHRTTVERVLPRRTSLVGPGPGERDPGWLLCANADVAAVVAGLRLRPAPPELERLLSSVRRSRVRPLVVLSGTDLLADRARVAAAVGAVAAAVAGVPVLTVDARTGEGVATLRAHVEPGRTLALLGAAGPGRSWLVDALVGAEVLATRTAPGGRSSGTGGRGLVPLPGGGAVIDTPARPPAPGLRESGHRL
jgi:ribosome biogenesis GTPase / thiamine phosphate phosphatase